MVIVLREHNLISQSNIFWILNAYLVLSLCLIIYEKKVEAKWNHILIYSMVTVYLTVMKLN